VQTEGAWKRSLNAKRYEPKPIGLGRLLNNKHQETIFVT